MQSAKRSMRAEGKQALKGGQQLSSKTNCQTNSVFSLTEKQFKLDFTKCRNPHILV